MCRFMVQQPLCPCPAGAACTQLGRGSTIYKKKRLHFRGELLIRSAACSEQLKLGRSEPRRDCPKTSEESRQGWQSDPYGCVRDLRICVDCRHCPRPEEVDSGEEATQGGGGGGVGGRTTGTEDETRERRRGAASEAADKVPCGRARSE